MGQSMPIGVYDRTSRPVEERFWSHVTIPGDKSSCWEWSGATSSGYGKFWVSRGKNAAAHRVAYELLVGEIPPGMVLDHLCRNRSCVFFEHLEPVTDRENILRGSGFSARNARKTECPQGHEYRMSKRGKRYCYECYQQQRAQRRWQAAS